MKWLGTVKSLTIIWLTVYHLATIWLIFTLMFAILGFTHLRASRTSIDKFEAEPVEYNPPDVKWDGALTNVEVDKPLRKFVQDFNLFIESYNKSASCQNKLAAYGYFLAALTALFSMILEIKSKRKFRNKVPL